MEESDMSHLIRDSCFHFWHKIWVNDHLRTHWRPRDLVLTFWLQSCGVKGSDIFTFGTLSRPLFRLPEFGRRDSGDVFLRYIYILVLFVNVCIGPTFLSLQKFMTFVSSLSLGFVMWGLSGCLFLMLPWHGSTLEFPDPVPLDSGRGPAPVGFIPLLRFWTFTFFEIPKDTGTSLLVFLG